MTAMVGKPRNQINMPRPDAYGLSPPAVNNISIHPVRQRHFGY